MMGYTEIDTLSSNLIVLGPDGGPPMQNIRKINILWGGEPPIKNEKRLENDLPDGPQTSRFACTEVQACRIVVEGF